MATEYQPSYLALYESGELAEGVQALEKLLLSCTVCPHDCGNNRMEDELARCYSGRLPIVSSYTHHFGEEPCLVGTRAAGLIFLRQLQRQNHPFKYNNLRMKRVTVYG